MTRRARIALACAAASAAAWGLAAAGPVAAHHSAARFDSTIELEITGTVRDFSWTNPHSWIELDVAGEGDEPVLWSIEMNPPAMLTRNGWRRSSLKPGDEVTLVVYPLRDGQPGGTIVRAVLADGTVLEGRSR